MKPLRYRLGVIGCGNMARAILTSVSGSGLFRARDVFVYDVNSKAQRDFVKRYKVKYAKNVSDIFCRTDLVLLAVKPQQLKEALANMRGIKVRARFLITILAGAPRKKVSALLPERVSVVRAMPNLGAAVGASFTAVSGGRKKEIALARRIFESCGVVIEISEKHMDVITVLSGSGPAYFYLLMEMLAREGIKHGLSYKASQVLAKQTALGASKFAQSVFEAPVELRKKVTSRGGTTEAVIKELESSDIREIFARAIGEGLKRARKLGGRK